LRQAARPGAGELPADRLALAWSSRRVALYHDALAPSRPISARGRTARRAEGVPFKTVGKFSPKS